VILKRSRPSERSTPSLVSVFGSLHQNYSFGNPSSRSRGFNSLPVKASQPAGSEPCMDDGNATHEA
jgi:hypothetical protein